MLIVSITNNDKIFFISVKEKAELSDAYPSYRLTAKYAFTPR